ncbi:hypothetical protein SAMN03159423_4914 [Bradyrhizobium sp. NFR13]|uniref:DUF6894 family protein n=1 Tax=Bradyrhizobium sp. NFR13 TaxID=1566285 RepID=UPI0008EBEB1E|nr:hypothetical protein [Bradyrhizobium sp. NFR13]SFM02896.1 hypothetical protein SAMN03159423_4914 [Bradyrhizobium sp. NFR13]
MSARYFFNLTDGTELPDLIGTDLATDEAAIAHAREIASNLAVVSPANNGPQRYVSVIHEDGHEVGSVPVYKEQFPPND